MLNGASDVGIKVRHFLVLELHPFDFKATIVCGIITKIKLMNMLQEPAESETIAYP